jgi:hypothetical protein
LELEPLAAAPADNRALQIKIDAVLQLQKELTQLSAEFESIATHGKKEVVEGITVELAQLLKPRFVGETYLCSTPPQQYAPCGHLELKRDN